MRGIVPCLWFDGRAEEAAAFYVAVFPGSSIDRIDRSAADNPGTAAGDVLTVEFTLDGRRFCGLNGGPHYTFNEAISFQVECADQAEIDHYWAALSAHPDKEGCGWCKYRFGVSWQVFPTLLPRLMSDPDRAKGARVMKAMMAMKKIDIAALERAAAGG